ncbi:MAG: enoyl-CoA hydratase/isomerase family protein [Thermodesulfobacteriota bacterium]|tara:strand:- start:17522 stop:18265 length:744 start_codon:yes stop_codon:yes gene_type:complete
MGFISVDESDKILTLDFVRYPVNAINHQFLLELNDVLDNYQDSSNSSVVVFSGSDLKFFSFGLDIPEYLTLDRSDLKDSLNLLVSTCNKIYQYPKITISKINGHATGGGCMIALSTDFRYMADGRSKIALNEINIGLSLFSSTIQILKSVVGVQNAKTILYSGKMFSPYEAKDLGLVDLIYDSDDLVEKNILSYATKNLEAIKDLKKSLNIFDQSALLDTDEKLELFLDIFYSDTTQEILKKIKINK